MNRGQEGNGDARVMLTDFFLNLLPYRRAEKEKQLKEAISRAREEVAAEQNATNIVVNGKTMDQTITEVVRKLGRHSHS